MEDDTLAFFNDIFTLIPNAYKMVPKDYQEVDAEELKKAQSKSRNKRVVKPMSMIELKEKAQQKIEDMNTVNREKSQKKIQEITKKHQQEIRDGTRVQKMKGEKRSKQDETMFDDLEGDLNEKAKADDDDDDNKLVGKKRDGDFKNKGKLDKSKLENKRKQKEAKKNKKINQQKGIPMPMP